ncbi:M protein [Campana virus]|uniref:Envelopment polyprotein n=2 Tax=Phlebovirus TaxID=11584 RepID=A0A0F6X2S9_9VIRU|nr:M protein [Campana virus]AKF42408.1 M protein [Campana virus]
MLHFITITTKFLAVASMYNLLYWDPNGLSRLCLSNNSPLEGLVYYWENLMKESDFKKDKKKHCRIGTSVAAPVTNETLTTLIEEVQKSPSEIILQCESRNNDTGNSIYFDGLADDIESPSIVNCESGKRESDLRVLVGQGLKKEIILNEIAAIDRQASLEEHLRGEKALTSLLQEISKQDEAERKRLEHEVSSLRQQLMNEREENKKRKNIPAFGVSSTTSSSLMNISRVVTIGLLSQQAIANPSLPGQVNTWPHAKNRIGQGLYRIDTSDEDGCRGLNYGVICLGFDHLLRMDLYPFFNAYVSHLSLLEAYTENIIQKDETECEIEGGKEFKCYEERAYIKGVCPHRIKSAHYLDQKGKLRIIKCKENLELTEDCTYCRKIKKDRGHTKQVYKTSVPLQDAICQDNSDDYSGPKISFKGVCKIGMIEYKECKYKSSSFETVGFITIKEKGKFYIEDMKLKNLEVTNNVAFICHQYTGQDGTTDEENRHLKRMSVKDCKNVNSSKSKYCTGDHIFCQVYDCTKSYPEATCFVAPGSGPVLVQVMGSWIKPQCVGYEKVLVEREVKMPILTEERDCDTCVYECKEDHILIKSTGFNMISAVACSHGSCVSAHQDPSTFLNIEYPGMSASVGGEIGIHISHTDDSLSLHKKIYCPARDSCEAHNCIMCYHGLINYQCHTALSYAVVSFMFVSIAYVIFNVLRLVLVALHVVPRKLKSPIDWLILLIKWVFLLLAKVIRAFLTHLNTTIGWRERQNNFAADLEAQRRPLQRFKTTVLLMMMLISVVSSCSNSVVSNSKQTRCIQSGSNTKCSVSATITLKAGVIGAESCFVIKGPSENQHKTIVIRTVSSETICREGSSFWTGHFTPSCLSSRRCHLVGDCVGSRCQGWREDVISREFGGVKDNNQMSENKCFEQCGAAGCGCFNINPSCLYVHTILRSARNEAVRVFKCNDWVHKLTFHIKGPNGEEEDVVLNSLSTKFLSWGTISLSLDSEGITGTNSYSFLESSKGGFAIHDEEFSEIPREGFLGEIRCSSESAVVSAHKSCIRAPGLIKYKPMTDQVECSASLVDPFAIFIKGSLPQTRSGYTFTSSRDKRTIQAFNNGAIKALLTLNLDDHEVIFSESVITCECTFLNISGCYSCNFGAQVCFKIKSSGIGDFVSSSETGNILFSFPVKSGTEDYCQIQHFNSPMVSESLQYSCGGESKLLLIKGSLISVGPYDYRNKTGGSSTVVNPAEDSWSIFNWLSGFLDWLGGPLRALVKIALAIIGALALLFITIMLARSVISNTLSRKKKN